MTFVKNEYGIAIHYDVAVSMMDDEIREELHNATFPPCTEQDFFDAYAIAHENKFHEPWVLNTQNPQY